MARICGSFYEESSEGAKISGPFQERALILSIHYSPSYVTNVNDSWLTTSDLAHITFNLTHSLLTIHISQLRTMSPNPETYSAYTR